MTILAYQLLTPFLLPVFQGALPAQPAPRADETLTCRVEQREGTRILFLDGSIEERGFGEGSLLCEDILGCFEEFAIPYVTDGEPKLWDLLVRPAVLLFRIPDETRVWSRALLRGMESRRGGPIRIEALGRVLDSTDVIAWSLVPDLAGFACSSLAVWDDASESGNVLVGRNLDYSSSPLIQQNSMVEVHAPMEATGDSPAKAGWVGMGWPGTFGCLTGLSEHGVFAAIHDVYGGDPKLRPGHSNRMLALSEFLESAKPDDALPETFAEKLRERPFAMGGNFMIAWQARGEKPAARGAAVIEVGVRGKDKGITPRSPRPGETFIACSNDHFERDGQEPGCYRYRTLLDGARAARSGQALDAKGLWVLVDEAGMEITLYRCVADLGEGTMTVKRRTGDSWAVTGALDVGELLR